MPFPGLEVDGGAGRVFPRGRRRPAHPPGTSADTEWNRWPCYALRVTGHLRWLPALGAVEISGLRRHARRRERAAAGGPAPCM